MNKTEYMNTLRQELEGLPAEIVEDTMWAYEGRFVDGMVAGRDELEIAASLPAPHIVAAQKRAGQRYQELKKNATPTNFASLLVALVGVLVFNLFMIVPAIVYSSLLFASYISSLAMYVVGIVITATVLSGAPQINLSIPTHHSRHVHDMLSDDASDYSSYRGHRGDVTVDITPTGINVEHEGNAGNDKDAGDVAPNPASSAAASAATSSLSAAPASSVVANSSTDKSLVDDTAVHVRIGNHLKSVHIFHGLGFLLAGIALFMFSLFMTKYTFIGFKNYLRWNISLLRPSSGTSA